MTSEPTTTPRREKRAPSEATGIASQPTAGECGPPDNATDAAIITWASSQAAASPYSGRCIRGVKWSKARNPPAASTSGRRGQGPIHGALSATAVRG